VRGVFAAAPHQQMRMLTPHPESTLRAASDLSPQAGRGDWRRGQFVHTLLRENDG